jgi:hypothetical protein
MATCAKCGAASVANSMNQNNHRGMCVCWKIVALVKQIQMVEFTLICFIIFFDKICFIIIAEVNNNIVS